MGSFLKAFRSSTNSVPSVGTTTAKKELTVPSMTALEKRLQDIGPIRDDGTDKFFGMENYGNTCYCNSILQCLYYSAPFREAVINYPRRTPIESLEAALAKNLRYQDPSTHAEAEAAAAKQKSAAAQNTARSPGGSDPNQPQKPEDKDSAEYKKKIIMQTLPLLEPKNNADSYGMSESLFTSLKDIFESVVGSQTRIGVVEPQHFLNVLRRENEMFNTAMHQDAHEFLNLLLNEVVANVEAEAAKEQAVGKSLPTPPDSPDSVDPASSSTGSKTPNTTRWVHELFEGTLTSETQCLTCEKVSQRDEIFLDLSVDLEQHSSVTSCLRKFSAEEMLCERNKFHCDNCGGLQEAEKRMKIKRLPRILALHLKRFKYTEDLQRLQKLFHRVVYPYHLRLFNTTDDAEDPDRLYELYAVVVHIGGGPYHGHYVAIIKTQDRGWLLFDDEMVEPVDKHFVLNFFGDRPGLACAYVLFYQETTLEAVIKEQEQEDLAVNQMATEVNDLAANKAANGFSATPGLSHIHSASQIPTTASESHHRFSSALKRAPTAPVLPTHAEHTDSEHDLHQHHPQPPVPSIPPSLATAAVSPKKTEVQSKKERAQEEKERKAAEKERERLEKQHRKEREAKLREDRKREDAEMRAAIEASKASKADEDRRKLPDATSPAAPAAAVSGKDNDSSSPGKKLPSGFSRLRRGSSKTIRLGKDKEKQERRRSPSDLPSVLHSEQAVEEHPDDDSNNNKNGGSMPSEHVIAIRDDEPADSFKEPKQHGKWRSFSLRKKSFSMLS